MKSLFVTLLLFKVMELRHDLSRDIATAPRDPTVPLFYNGALKRLEDKFKKFNLIKK